MDPRQYLESARAIALNYGKDLEQETKTAKSKRDSECLLCNSLAMALTIDLKYRAHTNEVLGDFDGRPHTLAGKI